MMPVIKEDKDRLLKTIQEKRRRIGAYLQEIEPRGSRLTNATIVFGGFATLLTASQLVFGRGSTNLLKNLYPIDGGVSVWQILAVAATICSAIAAIAGAMYKQQELAARLAKAQSCAAKLEALETSLSLDLISIKDANSRYAQCITEIPFVPAQTVGTGKDSVDSVKGGFTSPTPSQSLARAFQAAGSVSDLGPKIHLWLAVEANGFIWPKEGQIFPDESGSWTATVFEDGATDLFCLSLLAADERAHKQIGAWLTSGKRSGSYAQLTLLSGTRRVARVDGLRLSA
jgi:hypothetical protein